MAVDTRFGFDLGSEIEQIQMMGRELDGEFHWAEYDRASKSGVGLRIR